MRRTIRFGLAGLLTVGLLTVGMSAAPAAFAKGAVIGAKGSCSASSSWVLSAKSDNGKIEVEFEVDSNARGQKWDVALADNGTTVFQGVKKTKHNDSFTLRKKIANLAGTDMIDASATNQTTGETCMGSVSV